MAQVEWGFQLSGPLGNAWAVLLLASYRTLDIPRLREGSSCCLVS